MQIALGCDHRGRSLKQQLGEFLAQAGHEVHDRGTDSDQAVDYPDIAADVARQVGHHQAERGILVCGTGIGMAITANKFPGVRAAVCADQQTAEICRRHNDVNVLCLPGELSAQAARAVLDVWLRTDFEGGRHARRVDKITALDQQNPSER